MHAIIKVVLLLVLFQACQSSESDPIKKILNSDHPSFEKVMSDPEHYQLQVIYTQIDRDTDNHPTFTTFKFPSDSGQYFYPASTVKMPVAFLALEKLNQSNIEGLNRFTAMFTDSAYEGQTKVRYDSTAADLKPSIGHYIKKVFLVSDNDAFNRLYEFVGQRTINSQLKSKGFDQLRLVHRLSIALSPEQNRHTNPIDFYQVDSLVYHQEAEYNNVVYRPPGAIMMGTGHLSGDKLINEPMDFTDKNYISLEDLHGILQSVIFPEAHFEEQRFQLTADDSKFLYQYMSQLPSETDYPQYPAAEYYDSYVKFFMYGDSHDPIPKNIRIFNKVGQAYGYLIDVAYIVDFENQIEFMLSAVIHVNENQIFNDGIYEYDSLGIPFLAQLGRSVYELEQNRLKERLPDLSKFKVNYDH